MRNAALSLLALAATACSTSGPYSASPRATPPQDARSLHDRLLTMDTHLDTPMFFGNPNWKFAERGEWPTNIAQVDLGRMDAALDGGMFVIYTSAGPVTAEGFAAARAHAFERLAQIEKRVAAHPDRVRLVTTADQAIAADQAGKRFAFISIENSYPIGDDLSMLSQFYRRGVRMAGPVHSKDNQLADSATGDATWRGLSPLGKKWVAEMNRLGMVIDGSHSSDLAFDQMVALSKTPLILSHSGPKANWDHPRNIDDDRIRKLAASGGAICMNSVFLTKLNYTEKRLKAQDEMSKFATLSAQEVARLTAETRRLDASEPVQDTDFEAFMRGLLHLLKVAGPDHVCMGADWDGGGGVRGFEDITELPKVTERLVAAGYSEADIAKIWSGNVLRLMRAADAARSR